MIDDNQLKNEICLPAELQQKLPRRIRPTARGIYYLVGSMLVSLAIVAFVMIVGSLTPKEIEERNDLQREGSLTYTNSVQVGGMRSATVFYTFIYNGESYSGKAYLPREYLEKVSNYSKLGHFPVLFLPRNPSINHPYDWEGSGSFPFVGYALITIIIIQWSLLIRLILQDLRLARYGVVAIGKVTQCSYDSNRSIKLRYEFRDMDGLLTEGSGDYLARRNEDAQICILYLPAESKKSRPYPLVLFRAVK
jgi:hypothetical protein